MRFFLFGLPAGVVAASSSWMPHGRHVLQDLSGPPCNSIITTVKVEEVLAITDTWLTYLHRDDPLSATDLAAAKEAYTSAIQYDMLVSKVCGSCQDFQSQLEDNDTDSNDPYWKTYCGDDVYGNDATHSAIVFHPLDPETGEPIAATLNGAMVFQSTRLDLSLAFSTHFPTNMTEALHLPFVDFYSTFSDAYALMQAAGAGLIAIGPDYIGAGASAADYDRSYLTRMPVEQAAVVSWYAAQTYTRAVTNGCTQLNDQIVAQGFSSGGAGVIFGAQALQLQGVEIVQTFSHAGLYSVSIMAHGAMGT